MHTELWERALQFLKDMGHPVTHLKDGSHVSVERKDYHIGELAKLAERLHPAEWRKSENAYASKSPGNSC